MMITAKTTTTAMTMIATWPTSSSPSLPSGVPSVTLVGFSEVTSPLSGVVTTGCLGVVFGFGVPGATVVGLGVSGASVVGLGVSGATVVGLGVLGWGVVGGGASVDGGTPV